MKITRRMVRVILLIVATPVLLLSTAIAVILVNQQLVAGAAISRYEVGAFEASADSAESLLDTNLVEGWIAYFDRGTARAAAGLYNESIDDLERAFDLAPEDRRCDVALNLSLAWESLGDEYLEQGQFAGAVKLFDLARAALEAAGDGCGGEPDPDNARPDPNSPTPPGEPDPRSRLDDKSTRAQELDAAAKALEEPQETGPLGELEQQNDDSAEEKERQQRQRESVPGPARPGDKPW